MDLAQLNKVKLLLQNIQLSDMLVYDDCERLRAKYAGFEFSPAVHTFGEKGMVIFDD